MESSVNNNQEEEAETIKHPLQSAWTFWYDHRPKGSVWGTTLKRVIEFSTVEDFWGVFNNIAPPSKLMENTDYHIFREGIEPTWEDPKNKNGGKIYVDLQRSEMDENWKFSVLSAIGEKLESSVESDLNRVCGVCVNIKHGSNRICVWVDSTKKDEINVIGREFRRILDCKASFYYLAHNDKKFYFTID